MNVVRLSALRTGRIYPPPQEVSLVLVSVRDRVDPNDMVRPEELSKKLHDTIGNQTRGLSPCNAVSQPTAPPRALIPQIINTTQFILFKKVVFIVGIV